MIYFNSSIFKFKYGRLLKKIFNEVINELNYKEEFEIELNFIKENKIKDLNNNFRNINKITDVLSFPYFNKEDFYNFETNKMTSYNFETNKIMLGEIDICFKIAKKQAKEYNHSTKREVGFLFLHGMLHIFGYDHIKEEDRKQMREKEKKILNKIKLGR